MNRARKKDELDAATLEYLFSGDTATTGSQRRDRLIEFLVGISAPEVEALILGGEGLTLPTGSVQSVPERLAGVVGVQIEHAARLLGLSERAVRRGMPPPLSTAALSRLLLVCELFADVAGVLGMSGAQTWFSTPNWALDHQQPIQLLGSRIGEEKVRHLIGALLDGAYP